MAPVAADPVTPRRRNIDPDLARDRASRAAYASHAPRAHINALARATLTPDELSLLRELAIGLGLCGSTR